MHLIPIACYILLNISSPFNILPQHEFVIIEVSP